MSVTLEAVVENGLLRPIGPLTFGERERVEITVRSLEPPREGRPPNGTEATEPAAGEAEYDPRGVLGVAVRRPVVAEDASPLDLARLPRWRPAVSIDPHWLEEADE